MTRYTAMRTAKIAAAVAGPLAVMTCYLKLVYDWQSDYWLALLIVLVLISLAPALTADPIAEDEAARTRRGEGLYFIVIFMGLNFGLNYVIIVSLVCLLIALSQAQAADRIVEEAETRTRRDKTRSTIALLIGLGAGLLAWLAGRPGFASFLSSLKPHLRDWKPTTAVALLCLMMMRVGLRKALAFQAADLYPHLRQAEPKASADSSSPAQLRP